MTETIGSNHIPALELHMKYPNVSALVIASAVLAVGLGPALAEKGGDQGSVYDRVCAAPQGRKRSSTGFAADEIANSAGHRFVRAASANFTGCARERTGARYEL
jgi:hypothetical protein